LVSQQDGYHQNCRYDCVPLHTYSRPLRVKKIVAAKEPGQIHQDGMGGTAPPVEPSATTHDQLHVFRWTRERIVNSLG